MFGPDWKEGCAGCSFAAGHNQTGPNYNLTDWVRHHDRYDTGHFVEATGRYIAPEGGYALLRFRQGTGLKALRGCGHTALRVKDVDGAGIGRSRRRFLQRLLQMPVKLLRHCVDIGIVELPEDAHRLVIFKSNTAFGTLAQEHAGRRVEPG